MDGKMMWKHKTLELIIAKTKQEKKQISTFKEAELVTNLDFCLKWVADYLKDHTSVT